MQGAQVPYPVRELDSICHNSNFLYATTKTQGSQINKQINSFKGETDDISPVCFTEPNIFDL